MQLLDRRGDQGRVLTQEAPLIGVAEEVDHSVADQAGRRVVTGHDQLEQTAEQLLLREPVVVVAGCHQHVDEIVLAAIAVRRDEALQCRDDGVRRGDRFGRR